MAPERSPKRQKLSTSTESPSNAIQPSQIPLPPDTPNIPAANAAVTSSQQPQRASFFSSWSRKAPAIAQAAQEGIKSAGSAASSAASDVASSIKDVQFRPRSTRSPSLAMTLGKGKPSRASPVDATTTMVNAEANSPAKKSSKPAQKKQDVPIGIKAVSTEETADKNKAQTSPKTVPPALSNNEAAAVDINQVPSQRSSWLGWLGKTEVEGERAGSKPSETDPKPISGTAAKSNPEPGQPSIPVSETTKIQSTAADQQVQESVLPLVVGETTEQEAQTSRRSWLPLWSAASTANLEQTKPDAPTIRTLQPDAKKKIDQKPEESSTNSKPQQVHAPASSETESPPALPYDATKPSAWAFWSRDRKSNGSVSSNDKQRDGEIAIAETSSQNKPRRASFSVPSSKEEGPPETPNLVTKAGNPSALSTVEKAIEAEPSKVAGTGSIKAQKKQNSQSAEIVKAESSNATAAAVEVTETTKPASTKSTRGGHKILLPSLHSTLKLPESPSLLLRLASLLYAAREPELRHLNLVKEPARISNALAIGVHGYFPTPLLRSVLGQPTGTSIKFADMAAKSIKRWTLAHGYECKVKTAALEGEGKIAERLELLWRLLLNWIDEIRKSDFILIACHSQGVPVAIMLVAKLIQFGCVNATKVGICAMAGVNMGPFPEYKSRWIGGSAGELFEFSDPSSRVSTDYLSALETVLNFGVCLTFIGSIDDQLVSLESSIYSPISHPHIFRAVSIDSRVHAPNFLSHLVGFALKLRNLGIEDHGLIRELSSPLAGSLYSGEGHSRIYEDDAVYDLSVSFSLETSSQSGIHISQKTVVSGGSNPYILPFAMRGILEEDLVKNELQSEVADLLKEFDDWKPTSKALKDVKFRLEGIRSKL